MSVSPFDYSNYQKPERHLGAYRFFFFCVVLLTMLTSCGVTRNTIEKETANHTIDNGGSDALFMKAVKQKIKGNSDSAFNDFLRYAQQHPENATAHYELARIWFERNHVPKALKEIKQAYQLDSANKWIHSFYADLLAYDGQYLKAAHEFSRLAQKEPRAPEDYLVRQAMLFQKAESYLNAIKVLDTLARFIGEDDEVLLLQKHQLYLRMNDVAGAAGEIRKLIDFYPDNIQYPLMLGNIYLNNGKPEEAATVFQGLEKSYPDSLEVQHGLMQYYMKIQDTTSLHKVVVRTFSNKVLDIRDRIDLLLPLLQQNNTSEKERALGKQLAFSLAHEEPLNPLALMLYGDLLMLEEQSDSALIYYKKVTEIDTTMYLPWQQIMMNFAANRQMDSVAVYSSQAIQYFPDEPIAYYFAGIAYSQLSQPEKAVSLLHSAVKLQEDDNEALKSEMLSTLGDAYNALKDFSAADSSYEAALKLMPDNITALNNYSYYLSLRGERLEDAAMMSAKTLKARPDEPTFLDTYGWILFKQKKYEEAKVQIEKAIELSGPETDGTLFEHLGDIEFMLGNEEAAVEAWEKALNKGGASDIINKKIKDKQWYE